MARGFHDIKVYDKDEFGHRLERESIRNLTHGQAFVITRIFQRKGIAYKLLTYDEKAQLASVDSG